MTGRTAQGMFAVVAAALVFAFPGIAAAQTYTGTPIPDAGTRDTGAQVLSATGASAQIVQGTGARVGAVSGTSRLAFTGADVLTIVVAAAGLVIGGTVLVRRTRRLN